jgi:predicted membrane protein
VNARQLLRRLLKSQWTRIFGPALIVLELLGVAAAIVTGDWSLTWVVPFFIVGFFFFIFIRLVIIALLFAFLFLFPVLVAVIVVWAAYTLFRKQQKKANLEASTRGPTTSSNGAQ